ncbi:MAG: ABC transporter substrate-binding protein [SAR324 cluster bacterium]|uniref:ABC transporter substrate-binding protein n=1 Tax=SAR324 cluster bacterium TaxID=2024889 RepID=A0A7X9IL67_9DELT|nr:ABC transporter substrate-binding protein [SAR324 cluster bacterium]
MRIISLDPALTEMLYYFGKDEELVGVSFRCNYPRIPKDMPRVTEFHGKAYIEPVQSVIADNLSSDYLLLDKLKALQPDVVLAVVPNMDDDPEIINHIRECLNEYVGFPVRLLAFHPRNLLRVLEMFEELGKFFKAADKGHNLAQKIKAQFMTWGDNFYERTKNKKVTFIAGMNPFLVAGYWIADIIRYASALPQTVRGDFGHAEVSWDEIKSFRPDVIIVAPQGYSLNDSKRSFLDLEKLPGWESIPAVKRGEVFFADGDEHFYKATPNLIESGGMIFSAIAGFDSGYICERDSMYRLRFLEMNRHKL